VGDIR
jgi:hypothetical protein